MKHCCCCLVFKLCPTLCHPMYCSPPGFSIREISQAKILEWVTISFSRGSSPPRDRTWVSLIGGSRFNLWATRETHLSFNPFGAEISLLLFCCKSCPTLCDPMDCSPPGSSVHGIFQARVLEWVAISFSRGSSRPRDRTWVSLIAGGCFTDWATREAHQTWQSPRKNLRSWKWPTGVGTRSV